MSMIVPFGFFYIFVSSMQNFMTKCLVLCGFTGQLDLEIKKYFAVDLIYYIYKLLF